MFLKLFLGEWLFVQIDTYNLSNEMDFIMG